MARILLLDYIGHSDINGNPLGHTIKTIEQYGNLLSLGNSVDIAINKSHDKFLETECFNRKILFEDFNEVDDNDKYSSIKKVLLKRHKLKSIIKSSNYDLIIFVNIDFNLGLYIKKLRTKSKIIVISYMNKYHFGSYLSKSIKNRLLKNILDKSNYIITSDKKACLNNKFEYIPDYFYYPEVYDKYRKKDKKNEYLCIGTISNEKDIELIVRTFINKSVKLSIIGKFYDSKLYERLMNIKTDNIYIENRITGYDEYYNLIASYQYIILPYKKEFYEGRSSGVLLETIFLDSVPIAPKFLLEENEINGLKYENYEQLEEIIQSTHNNSNFKNDLSKYDYEKSMKQIRKLVENVVNTK